MTNQMEIIAEIENLVSIMDADFNCWMINFSSAKEASEYAKRKTAHLAALIASLKQTIEAE